MATDGECQLRGIVTFEDSFRATIPRGVPSQLEPNSGPSVAGSERWHTNR